MCGIFGQINTKYDDFDYKGFTTLGIINDVRGGDSVGIFIDGKTHYGVDKMKHFEDFMCASKLLDKTQKCRIAFGHCRKTSVGTTSLETAQPVVIRKKGVVEYVLMHNGTIHNYEDLAKKYIPDVKIDGMSDSQVMARIFYAGHYEAIEEYNGGAVFAILDYRRGTTNPLVLFFKGASKKSEYCKSVEEERPLYFTCNKDTMYFSSIDSILQPMLKKEDVYTFGENILYEYEAGEIYEYQKFDRSLCCQNKITTKTLATCNNYSYGQYSFEDLDDSYGSYGNDNLSNSCSTQYTEYMYPEPYNTEFPSFAAFANIPRIELYREVETGKDLMYYQKFKYNLLHGGLYISGAGIVYRKKESYNEQYWFWQGILLKNKKCFDYLLRIQKELNCDETDLSGGWPELISCLSALPVYDCVVERYFDGISGTPYDGTISIPFTKKRMSFYNGKSNTYFMNNEKYSGSELLEEFKDYDPCTDDAVITIVGEKTK